MGASRSVRETIESVRTLEGGGFPVRRPFPTAHLPLLDPFLLLDHMGPVQWPPGKAVGAPDHPHRGFETVTYLLQGKMEHRDSSGNHGVLGPGDVQWMTAGAGVIHSELPEAGFKEAGGTMHGFQLWVNLPKKDKWRKPRYQDIPADRIPKVLEQDGKLEARVLAGQALGASAVIDTVIPILYVHYTLLPGARVRQPVPREQNAFCYVINGSGRFGPGGEKGRLGQLLVWENDGDEVELENPEDGRASLDVLLLAGRPLNEPVARYGPFVMNTEEEIVQALKDYQSGTLGLTN